MAFIFVNDPDEDTPTPKYTLQSSIQYSGPNKGRLVLRCDGRFAATLAANLLGVDPQDSEAEKGRLDALRELMNVFCGNFVTEAYGTDGLYELSIPEVIPILQDEPPETLDATESYRFMSDESQLEIFHVPQ